MILEINFTNFETSFGEKLNILEAPIKSKKSSMSVKYVTSQPTLKVVLKLTMQKHIKTKREANKSKFPHECSLCDSMLNDNNEEK